MICCTWEHWLPVLLCWRCRTDLAVECLQQKIAHDNLHHWAGNNWIVLFWNKFNDTFDLDSDRLQVSIWIGLSTTSVWSLEWWCMISHVFALAFLLSSQWSLSGYRFRFSSSYTWLDPGLLLRLFTKQYSLSFALLSSFVIDITFC